MSDTQDTQVSPVATEIADSDEAQKIVADSIPEVNQSTKDVDASDKADNRADGSDLTTQEDDKEDEHHSEDEFSDPTEVPADEAEAETGDHAENVAQQDDGEAPVPLSDAAQQPITSVEAEDDEGKSVRPAPLDLEGKDKEGDENPSSDHSKPSTPLSAKSAQSLAPQIRYMLPIGGPGRRPRTSPRVSSLNNGAGPSATETSRAKAIAKFEKMIEEEEKGRQQSPAKSATAMRHSKTNDDLGQERPAPSRRLSSSDIPPMDEASTSEIPLDASPPPAALSLRRRSNTLAERGEKRQRPRTAPAKSIPNGNHADVDSDENADQQRKGLKRLDTASTMMVDGQMFFLDEDPMKQKNEKRRSSLNLNGSAEGPARRASKSGGRRLLDRAADLGDMTFLSKAMRKPVKARDEPMIYDADELDDVPPPGAYAIHPPSQTRLQEAARLSLFDEDGNLVRFGTIFESQRTLIIFLRHWLCPFCQMFAQSIKNIDPLPLQRADLGLVVVGQGHAHVTKSYKQVMKIPAYVRVFSDPTRKIYQALGMTLRTNDAGPACARPDYQTMGVMKASFKAIKHGLVDMPVRLPGDTKLLGGEFILGPGLDCSFTHRMVTVRGHLDLPRILVQAGCDLSLKTPKDLLKDHDTASARGRPGSTRSVDRVGARKLARRLARKTHAATPKDILLMKSQRAAKTAAQRGSLNRRARASYDDTMQSVDGKRHTAPRAYDDLHTVDGKSRGKLPEGMRNRGLSVGARPQTSGSLPGQVSSPWTREPARPHTATSAPPPLPRTSSADAFRAAKARRQFFINEGLEELYDDEFDGLPRSRRDGTVRELRKRFTDSSAGTLSTSSLGRSSSHRSQYQREQQRRQAELNEMLARSSFGPGGLNALQQGGLAYQSSLRPNTSDASLSSSNASSQLSSMPHRRTPSTQSLPLANLANRSTGALTPGSVSSSTFANLPPTSSDRASTKRSPALPLSTFERKSNDPGHGVLKSSSQASYDGRDAQSPMSASFGEDTDYKRLPRSAFEPSSQAYAPHDADENTPTFKASALPLVDSPPPPPVPPKSPPKSPLPNQSAPPPPLASRAPVPAPTPLFAALFAAEEARRRALQDSKSSSTDTTTTTTTTPKSAAARLPTVAPSFANVGSTAPALWAGLPPPSTQSKSPIATTPTQSTFSAQQNQNPLLQAARPPISSYVRPPRAEGVSATAPPRISVEESVVATSAAPSTTTKMSSQQSGSSFLDDLETVDGFKRRSRTSTSTDSAFLSSPVVNRLSMGDASRTEDDDDDDDDDEVFYANDWEPLHARQNVIPKALKSPVEPDLRPLSFASSNGASRRSEEGGNENGNHSPDDDDDEVDDTSENDTEGDEGGIHTSAAHPLALLGILSNGKKRLSAQPDTAVVKRVISRPNSAPTSPITPTSNGPRSPTTGTLSGSARLVHLNRLPRKPPQSAGSIPVSSTGRKLTSFAEEEEEESAAATAATNTTSVEDSTDPAAQSGDKLASAAVLSA